MPYNPYKSFGAAQPWDTSAPTTGTGGFMPAYQYKPAADFARDSFPRSAVQEFEGMAPNDLSTQELPTGKFGAGNSWGYKGDYVGDNPTNEQLNQYLTRSRWGIRPSYQPFLDNLVTNPDTGEAYVRSAAKKQWTAKDGFGAMMGPVFASAALGGVSGGLSGLGQSLAGSGLSAAAGGGGSFSPKNVSQQLQTAQALRSQKPQGGVNTAKQQMIAQYLRK